jgi:hypothetical protein
MNIDQQVEQIQNDPNLTQGEKEDYIAELEECARDHDGQLLAQREALDRQLGG